MTSFSVAPGTGLPLGNLTSQLFANVYLNPLDKFVKHTLGVQHYLRYADDFVLLSADRDMLVRYLNRIRQFLAFRLLLSLHPDKIVLRTLNQGIDFVGYVVRPHHIVLRTKTKRRMLTRVDETNLASYMGLLEHCNGYLLQEKIQQLVPPEGYEPPF